MKDKYFVVGLTNKQVAEGMLTKLADVVRKKFIDTAEKIRKEKVQTADQLWAKILFDADLLGMGKDTSKFMNSGYDQVLYINLVAWNLIEGENFPLKLLEKTDKLPSSLGTFISMPYWVW